MFLIQLKKQMYSDQNTTVCDILQNYLIHNHLKDLLNLEQLSGEVGFARDVCVKLGRDLINTLKLTYATKPCQDLGKFELVSKSLYLSCFGYVVCFYLQL